MKKRMKTRILSLMFCFTLIFSQCGLLNVGAITNGDNGNNEPNETTITEFALLDETVVKQTVPCGTPLQALSLPDTLSVRGYIYNETVAEPVSENMTIENISWTAVPEYDGNTAGDFVFSPELSCFLVKADTIPAIAVTVTSQENTIPGAELVAEEFYTLEEDIDLAAMEAGLENNPRPLTMEDLITDFGIQVSADTSDQMPEITPAETESSILLKSMPLTTRSMTLLDSEPAATYPDTIVIGNDNENNAHAGVADNDVDVYMNGWKSNYPVEISFTLDKMPTESAYIAVKAYDVDEESGEKDYVFINDAPAGVGEAGASIGYLSGNGNKWNTTVLQIPLSKLKLGKNYVSFNISKFWCVTVDWVQIILDGGAVDPNISDFSIKLDDAVQSGSDVQISACVNIDQNGSTEYYTEYMLTNKAGDNLSSYFGKAVSKETAALSMPLNSTTGTYTVTGLIKDKTTETIKATDAVTFDFVHGQVPVFGPKVSHTAAPAAFTNGNVTIQLKAENDNPDVSDVQIWYENGNITGSTGGNITSANQSVSENGTYTFAIKFTRNGAERTTTYNAKVTNIDRVGPVITAADINVIEGTADADVLRAIDNTVIVTDDISLPADPITVAPDNGLAADVEDKTVTITATDTAGNETTQDITLTVTPRPVQITQSEADVNPADLTASLSAVLDYTGGLAITESGFVWGVSQNPTCEVCNDKKSIGGAVAKGESFSVVAQNIVEGVNYYVRAYVKAGSTYYYSDQKTFGIGAPQYGSFSVSADAEDVPAGGGVVTFTISRPAEQTEGNQKVYYRTVNGTAVGGLHFQHEIGTLTFAPGEHTKTVAVTVNGVAKQYETYPATAYQNTGRSFYLEIYKVEGGATIAVKNVKKTIVADNLKQIYAGAYNQYNSVDYSNSSQGEITDGGFNAGGNKEDKDTVNFTKLSNTDALYLDATADHYALKYNVKIKERYRGFQLIQVSTRTQDIMYFTDDSNLNNLNFGNSVFLAAVLEHGGDGGACTDYYTYTFPTCSVTKKRANFTDNNTAINIGKNRTVYVYYDASGSSDDNWYKNEFHPSVRAMDTTEPQLIAAAPMAGGTYSYGDEVYVSLIFNEIINSTSGVTIDTNLSGTPFVYEDGIGTNVLVFKGRVDKDGQNFGSVTVNSLNNTGSIKDIADYIGTETANANPSTDFNANTIRPGISFTGSTAGTLPRHNAKVTIENAVSARYTWSRNSAMPVSGWMNFSDTAGGTLTETLAGEAEGASAVWYLHVQAVHANGNTRWEHKEFTFQQPTMQVTADNTNWAQSRDITLTVTNSPGAPVNIAVTGAGTGTYTASGNVNVTTNGTYIFTLTDAYGSSIIKSVDAARIDKTEPVITLNEYGNTGIKYTALDFSASAVDEDGGSGLSVLQYRWADSTIVPADGWTEIALPGGSIPTYSTPGTAYLHIKAADNAGNTAYTCSKGYTVMSSTPPLIEVTGGIPADWQKGSVTLNYTVQKTGADIASINAAGTVFEDVNTLPTSYPYNGSIDVGENGLYTFMVLDENGLSDTKTVVVNYIDNEAPVAFFDYGAGNSADSWAQTKTVSINAEDEASSVVDSHGTVTGYGGSGVASVAWKKGSADYNVINNGGSINLDANTTCYIKVTDNVGNSTEYTLPISGIDTIGPSAGIAISAGWQKTGYGVVTYADDYSGIASAQYAVAAGKDVIPAVLSAMPESGAKIDVLSSGTSYIYYVVADNAGNITSGWSDPINVDNIQPELSVAANRGTAAGDVYISGDWAADAVVFTLGNSAAQLSGTTYQVRTPADETAAWSEWVDISDRTNSTHTVSQSTLIEFKAVSGSGNESTVSAYTVKIDKSAPADVSVSGTSDEWQKSDVTLSVTADDADSGIKEFCFSTDYGQSWSTSQPWNTGGANRFTIGINGDYTDKVKVKVKNNAGSATESDSYTVKLDKVTPVITVFAHKGTADGEEYISGVWTNGDVVFALDNSAAQLSGTTYQVKSGSGDWEPVIGNTYTISADTNTNYQFKAVSGANLAAESSATIVRIQKSLSKAMDISMLSPTPNTDTAWYTTDTIISVNKPAADVGKPAITVKYKLWNEKEIEPAGSIILTDTTIPVPSDGKWTLKIWTEDEGGNGTEPLIASYYIDTARPIIENVQYQIIGNNTSGELKNFVSEGNFFNKPIQVTATVSDAMSNPAYINYRLGDSGDYSDDIAVEKMLSGDYTASFNLPSGTNNTLNIIAKDVAGNQTQNPAATGNIIIEDSAPVITFGGADVTPADSDKWLAGSQTVTVNADDSKNSRVTSALNHINIMVNRWNGTAYAEEMTELNQSFSSISDTTAIDVKSHTILLNAGGKYEITVRAEDRAGNSADRTCYINVDVDNPTAESVLRLENTEVDNTAYYQDSAYTVIPAAETDVKQSPIKAQYKLNNTINPENNADEWTDVPENNIIIMAEGTNTVQLHSIDSAGNVSAGITYTVNRDITRPTIKKINPANGAKDQSIIPVISFTADEPLVKGDGYITILSKPLKAKVMDVHSSNNRVKLSDQNKTVMVNLPQSLKKGTEYYITVDQGFVTDRAGNTAAGFGSENTWRFNTIAEPVIPDSEITVLGYTVELIAKAGADRAETSQTLTAVTDKESARQHNIIAKASYTENGTDYYVKMKITPLMSAVPQEIRVSAANGRVNLSSDKKYIDVLIPQGVSEAVVTISLGSSMDNQFTVKIINSSYKAEVETEGGITAAADESNLLNSVDLSEEIEESKKPNTAVDVTVKMNIEKKKEAEVPDTEEIRKAASTGNLLFLDITLEKVVTTTIEGGTSESQTETIKTVQQPVIITIDLPQEMQGRYNYQIVRRHNGVIDILPAEVIDNGTRLRFEADRFSTYAVNYTARSKHKIIYPDAGGTADTITDIPVIEDNSNLDSITAESDKMAVDIAKLNLTAESDANINTLLPYYREDDEEIIAAFSAVIDGQMYWIARENRTYWFKYNFKDFKDIQTHWARNDILFTSAREMFTGTAPDLFSPEMSMTRGMFVTVLGRMWGADVTSFSRSSFTDVKADTWYAPYVEWAADSGIVSGYGNELFGPDDAITREQMAVMITNFIKYTGIELNTENEAEVFADYNTISPWAKNAVKTMQKAAIINGRPGNLFTPQDTATRAEVAAVLKRFIQNAVNESGDGSLTHI